MELPAKLVLVTLFFIIRHTVQAYDCRAMILKEVHKFSVPAGENCHFYCSDTSLYLKFDRWKKDDTCQAASGFSPPIIDIHEAPCDDYCPGYKDCYCTVQATSYRVRRYFYNFVDCNDGPYTARVVKREFFDVSIRDQDIQREYYSRGYTTDESVHCAEQ